MIVPGYIKDVTNGIPDYIQKFLGDELWTWQTLSWWKNLWEKTGLVSMDIADTLPDGCELWLRWDKALIDSGKHGDWKKLCSGPGKLCIAMGITREHYGQDLCQRASVGKLTITRGETITDSDIAATPRINVDYAGEASAWPYRFVVRESAFLSTRKFVAQ